MAVVAEDLLTDDAPSENAAGYSSLILRNRKIVDDTDAPAGDNAVLV